MELTNAKCPSCDAAIIVDMYGETTTCQYCGSTVSIKTAIEKIKKDGITNFDSYMVAAQNEIEFAEDFESAEKFYKKALEIKPNNYHAIWGIFICELNSIIYHHNRKGYVKVPGDTMDCVVDIIERYGKKAHLYAPVDIQKYYNDVFNYYLQ